MHSAAKRNTVYGASIHQIVTPMVITTDPSVSSTEDCCFPHQAHAEVQSEIRVFVCEIYSVTISYESKCRTQVSDGCVSGFLVFVFIRYAANNYYLLIVC